MVSKPKKETFPITSSQDDSSFDLALRLFHEAADRVPAYKRFLKENKIRPSTIQSREDFDSVPLTDKVNYFSRYTLEDLSWDGDLKNAKYVSKSSGSTGLPYFWPRGQAQDDSIAEFTRPIYKDIFGVGSASTLFVNTFSLGNWIAGIEFFNSIRQTQEQGIPVTIVTPGIDRVEVLTMIKKLSPFYDRIILAGYPPFIKDIIQHGIEDGIHWGDLDLRLLFAGESISEHWRDSVIKLANIDSDRVYDATVNIYGMAECGMVAHETPVSITLRRQHLENKVQSPLFPGPSDISGLYQYDPKLRYFEVVNSNSLILTANAGLPLIRYNTRDNGGIVPFNKAIQMGAKFSHLPPHHQHKRWNRPFVYLLGRKDLSLSFYALMIYIDNVKFALERSRYSDRFSGLFTMSVTTDNTLDQQFNLSIELARQKKCSPTLIEPLTSEIATNISKVNSEYAKLYSAIGVKALPKITLLKFGDLETIPGKKHRWTKK